MKHNESLPLVREMMTEFAGETGLSPARNSPRRYLWTDAFAVCNFLGLYDQAGEERCLELALQLVDQVHQTLGRHREDDPRRGWISGLGEEEGKRHPTRGGLRIGKGLNERGPRDPYDERLEWDMDGQYYHYLTKWMHALHCVSSVTGDLTYHTWAIELAKTAHAKFVYTSSPGRRKRMYWKMSIDLSRPLVPSMGHHDPLEGFVTYSELQATADRGEQSTETGLQAEIEEMTKICAGKNWATDDPLGMGGLLFDSCRVAQLIDGGNLELKGLLETLLGSSLIGLNSFVRGNSLKLPADYRLAFRELGLSIGLRAVEKIRELITEKSSSLLKKDSLRSLLEALSKYESLAGTIERFWLDPKNRESETWTAHHDINRVMLATSLAPDGFLKV